MHEKVGDFLLLSQTQKLPYHQVHLLAFKEAVSGKPPKIRRSTLVLTDLWIQSNLSPSLPLSNFWFYCSRERKRENPAEADRNMEYVKATNISSESIMSGACSKQDFN